MHAAVSRESSSFLSPVMTQNFSNDDKIGAWVYRYIAPDDQHMSPLHFSVILSKACEND
jgi:hypothetical protein